jgi:hypothetical protein
MTISLIIVGVAFLILLLLIRLATGYTARAELLDNPAAHIRSVDLEAFRNLIDPDEEEFLRSRMSSGDFRRVQRERRRAAVDYVSGVAHNAAILLALAQAARHSPDPAVAAAAEKLVENAIRLRLYAFQVIPRLYLGIVLPWRRLSAGRIAERYEQMTRQVVLLGLQYPMRGVSAAL